MLNLPQLTLLFSLLSALAIAAPHQNSQSIEPLTYWVHRSCPDKTRKWDAIVKDALKHADRGAQLLETMPEIKPKSKRAEEVAKLYTDQMFLKPDPSELMVVYQTVDGVSRLQQTDKQDTANFRIYCDNDKVGGRWKQLAPEVALRFSKQGKPVYIDKTNGIVFKGELGCHNFDGISYDDRYEDFGYAMSMDEFQRMGFSTRATAQKSRVTITLCDTSFPPLDKEAYETLADLKQNKKLDLERFDASRTYLNSLVSRALVHELFHFPWFLGPDKRHAVDDHAYGLYGSLRLQGHQVFNNADSFTWFAVLCRLLYDEKEQLTSAALDAIRSQKVTSFVPWRPDM